jgi:ferredoxin
LNRCQGYAQCCYEAPDAFKLKGIEILVYNPAPDKQLREAIDRAARACPVRAIGNATVDLKFWREDEQTRWTAEVKAGEVEIQAKSWH